VNCPFKKVNILCEAMIDLKNELLNDILAIHTLELVRHFL